MKIVPSPGSSDCDPDTLMNIQDESRPSGRRPANQQRNTAGSRDGTPGSQQARRGAKANQTVTRSQDSASITQNGSAPPPPTAPASEDRPSGPTLNVDEIKKLLESGMDANAEVYKAPKSPTKAGPPANPWAPKPGQMANGKDFFQELRKQVTEKLQEREQGEKPKQQGAKDGGTPAKGG